MRHLFNYMLLVMFLCLISNKVSAYDIAVPNEDGVTIYYNRIDDGELEVTYYKWNPHGYPEGYDGIHIITIPSQVTYSGQSFIVSRIGTNAFFKSYSLTTISLPNSMKEIDEQAFFESNITTVNFSNGLELIDAYAFSGCKNLTSINLPNGLKTVGFSAFRSCKNLTSINLPDGLLSIGKNAFAGCENLISINLPYGIRGVGEDAFSSCSKLENIIISSNTPINMTNKAFYGCTKLKRIEYILDDNVEPLFDISSFNIDTIVVSAKAYPHLTENSGWEKCNRIYARGDDKKLYIGIKNEYNNIVSVNDITNQALVFVPYDEKAVIKRLDSSPSEIYVIINGVSSLLTPENSCMSFFPSPYNSFAFNIVYVISRNMSGENDYSVSMTDSGNLLSLIGRDNLEKVKRLKIIGDINGIDVLVLKKMTYLEELDLSQANIVNGGSNDYKTSTDIIGDYFFSGMSNLIYLHLPESGKKIGRFIVNGCNKLQEVIIPGSFTSIDSYGFINSGLKKVVFKESKEHIIIYEKAFENTSISSLELYRNYNGKIMGNQKALRFLALDGQFTEIGKYNYDFNYSKCTSLLTLIIGPMIESIEEGYFNDLKSLENVVFKDSELSIELKGKTNMGFFGNSPIKSIYLGRNTEKGYAFMNLSRLSDLTISEKVSKIQYGQFKGCVSLQSINLPNSINSIGSAAFEGCENISDIKMPNKLEFIGGEAFKDCKSLKNIEIASTVTNIVSGAFEGCSSLTSIKIGDNVNYIDDRTFKNCTSLQYVRLGEKITQIGADAFENCYNIKTLYSWNPTPPAAWGNSLSGIDRSACTLYVPIGSGDLYWLHPEWGQFFDIKEVETENIRTTQMDDTTMNYYSIDGQQKMVPEKGINILRMSDGTTKKVYIK